MSIIEQAAKRLEELRRSGVDLTARDASRRAEATGGSAQTAIPELMRRAGDVAVGVARGVDAQPVQRPFGQRSQQVRIDIARLAA
ncbi:MAG: hypothetical protein N3D71_05135, partial [Burkholderiaceae bacterium]|nr:hypothetical protein [Burkholderiaceae bacterium]